MTRMGCLPACAHACTQGTWPHLQRALGDDQPVRVVVDVGEADAVLAAAEDAQPAGASRLEKVGEEEVVARPVDLVRRDGAGHQLVAAGGGELELAHGLGLGVRLQVAAANMREGGHLRRRRTTTTTTTTTTRIRAAQQVDGMRDGRHRCGSDGI